MKNKDDQLPEIYVTGHKNPDMDAICSSYCYAELKNMIDNKNKYIAIRSGALNKQTRYVFDKFKITPPRVVKDMYPRVKDVTRRDITTLDEKAPVHEAIFELDRNNLSLIPVFRNDLDFRGTISIHEISNFLISENLGKRPLYTFRVENFKKLLPGYFYRHGKSKEFSAPVMIGAMPLETSLNRMEELGDNKPLLVTGLREDLIEYAIKNQFPAMVLTGVNREQIPIDFSSYEGSVFISQADTAETTRLLRLCTPIQNVMEKNPVVVQSDDDFDQAKRILMQSDVRGLPVFEGDQFTGIVTRRCFIEKPRKKLILTDHNETDQSVRGADQAEIVEIIDHHRLNPGRTNKPIYVYAKPVGSSCTLVWQHYQMNGIKPEKELAILMLSGIMSDTVILNSPTTTDEDRIATGLLAEIAGVDYKDYGAEILSQSTSLRNADPLDIVKADFKVYDHLGFNVGIGQVEVQNFEDIPLMKEPLMEALNEMKKNKKLDWAMLLVTNVLRQDSKLLLTTHSRAENIIIFKKDEENLYFLPKVLSRKKQLLPEIFRIIEEEKSKD